MIDAKPKSTATTFTTCAVETAPPSSGHSGAKMGKQVPVAASNKQGVRQTWSYFEGKSLTWPW